ncbi:MAG TPA: GIY-YIG nuclease family protein [Candidatus Acidoferrum sp.]|nr:GIY-YIG nuclease family protein [Candidatus Acidoferrum sp.]
MHLTARDLCSGRVGVNARVSSIWKPFQAASRIHRYISRYAQHRYVAELGEATRTKYERTDSRLRVIYDNGTESDVFQRSFQRALHRDEAAWLITNRSAGPLFADEPEWDDLACDTIYVLRSKSDNPVFAANRDVLHKIGVTGGKIETRLANAAFDPTFLLADVEVVTTYVLYNVNRAKLENLIHRVFDAAQLDIEIKDRFGNSLGLGNR